MKRRREEEVESMTAMNNGRSEIRSAVEELYSLEVKKPAEDQKGIPTVAFLRLANLLLHVLDEIGPTMSVLRQDIQQNIKRLEELYILDPLAYSSLGDILKKDADEGISRKLDSCSRAILWLTRSMVFTVVLLERLEKDSELSLSQVVEEAYSCTLKPWHGWISSAAYKVALKIIPDKHVFINLLICQGQDYNELKRDIQKLLSLLQPLLEETNALLKAFRLDKLKST